MKNQLLKALTLVCALVLVFAFPISAEDYKTGDSNGDGIVNSDDAIYLLRHTLLPLEYPLFCNHNITEYEAKVPTCLETGWDTYEACSRCGYSTYVALPSVSHNSNKIVTSSDGSIIDRQCSWCGISAAKYMTANNVLTLDFDKTVVEELEAYEYFTIGSDEKNSYTTIDGRSVWAVNDATFIEYDKAALGNSGLHLVEFDMMIEGDNGALRDNSVFSFVPGRNKDATPSGATTQYKFQLKFHPLTDKLSTVQLNGISIPHESIDTVDMSMYTDTNSVDYTLGEWVTVSVIFDHDAKKTHVFVGDSYIGSLNAFGHDTESFMDAFTIRFCDTSAYSTYFDNFRITELTDLTCPAGGFHNLNTRTAKTPTCSSVGWDEYIYCSECDFSTYSQIEKLPHKIWIKETEETMVEYYTTTNDSVYPFTVNGDIITSTNKIDGTSSTYTITAQKAFTLELKYKVSSEGSDWDKFIIYHNNTQKAKVSGVTDWATLEIQMQTGDTVRFTYSKDGSVSKNDDCGYAQIITEAVGTETTVTDVLVDATDDIIATIAPTCADSVSCTVCGGVVVGQLGHDEVYHDAKAATCTAIGWEAYVTCNNCDYTTYEEIPALGHDEIPHEGQAATCLEGGWNPYVTCSRCDYTTYEAVSALGHDEIHHDAKPNCTEIGWEAYVTCSRCEYTTYVELPIAGHDEINHGAQAATCLEIGWNAYVTCSRCDYTTYEEIPALGHSYINDICTNCGKVKASDGLLYTSNGDGTCYVSGIGTCTDEHVIIPETSPEGDRVIGIGEDALERCESMISVTIPDSVTSIGNGAFGYCHNLASVTMGDSVVSIGNHAFYECFRLTDIRLPDSVRSIGYYAFKQCYVLEEINIPYGVTKIDEYTFDCCHSLKNITIPNSVTSIGRGVFYDCFSLTEVSIPNSVTSLGDSIFSNCRSLVSLVIPDSVKTMPNNGRIISSCYGLKSLTIGSGVTSIYSDYGNCIVEVINKSSLNITKGSSDYGYVAKNALEVHSGASKMVNKNGYLFYTYDGVNYLIGYTGTDKILVLPESYNGQSYEIADNAFKYNTNIISVTIPSNVTAIGDAFDYCEKLVEIVNNSSAYLYGSGDVLEVHSGASKIVNKNGYLFYTCDDQYSYDTVNYLVGYVGNDTELVLPQSYNGQSYEIYDYAFAYHYNLKSVSIPEGVTRIGDYAFKRCVIMTNIRIPNSITFIGEQAFNSCFSLEYSYHGENYPYQYTYYLGNEQNPYLVLEGYYIEYGYTGSSVQIHNNTKIIDEGVFRYNNVSNITIPNSVVQIGDYAFYNCSMTSVTIPDSVISIGSSAFSDCDSLTSIVFEDTSTWYRTTSSSEWQNMTGGTQTDVSNSATNVTHFTDTYNYDYWYKD